MLKGIIFDMDGVLFDTERLITTVWYGLAEAWGIDRDKMEQAVIGCIGFNRTDTRNYFLNLLGADFEYEKFRIEASGLYQQKIDEEGLPVKEGVYELLEYIHNTGLRIGLASSTSTVNVKKHLEEAGLTHYFEAVIGGDQVEHSKPLPDIYLIACEAVGLKPEHCIAIEDSPNGIRAAHAAGMIPVMVPDLVQPDEEITNMLYRRFDSLLGVKDFLEKNAEEEISCEVKK